MSSVLRLASLALAVLAGFVTVLSTGPVAANFRLSQIAGNQAPMWFSAMAASGALVAALGFYVFGRLSDRLLRAKGSRQLVFVCSTIALAPIGFLLSIADSVPTLFVLWCLLQLPAAAVLSVGTAVVLEQLPARLLPLASSLFGVSGVLAILYGVVLGVITSNNPQLVLLLGTLTAVVLALPAALIREVSSGTIQTIATEPRRKMPKGFGLFLLGSAASLGVTALANDYFFQLSMRVNNGDKDVAADFSQVLFAFSAGAYLLSALGFALVVRAGEIARKVFAISLAISAVGILMLAASHDHVVMVVGALATGVGTGLNTASQLPVMKQLFGESQALGNPAGVFNVVGVLPSILVPLLGILFLSVSSDTWPYLLGGTVALVALGAALLAQLKLSSAR